jgi:hypothetical protein
MQIPGGLGVNGKGQAPRWRLTEIGYMRDPPTRDFMHWNGVRFSQHQPGGDQPKIQKPVRDKADEVSGKRETLVSGKTQTPCGTSVREKADKERAPPVREKGDKSIILLGGVGGALSEEEATNLTMPVMTVVDPGR